MCFYTVVDTKYTDKPDTRRVVSVLSCVRLVNIRGEFEDHPEKQESWMLYMSWRGSSSVNTVDDGSHHFYGEDGRFQPAAAASLIQTPDFLKSEMCNYSCRFRIMISYQLKSTFIICLICSISNPVRC